MMPLDPDAQAVLDAVAAANLPAVAECTPLQARERMQMLSQVLGDPEPVARVEDRTIPGPAGPIPVRVYTPVLRETLPVFVFIHGGGWVSGDLDTHDNMARSLARATRTILISVDYRRPPECPFPGPVEDCCAAVRWAVAHAGEIGGDAARLIIGGDSAGGNLAAATCLKLRDEGGPKANGQLLIYPVLDFNLMTDSYQALSSGYLLTRAGMRWCWNHYVPDPVMQKHPYAAPLRAESLAGLPPAVLVTAEYDPLKDEGDTYAARLQAAGVAVEHLQYAGQIHDFLRRPNLIRRARTALIEIATAFQRLEVLP